MASIHAADLAALSVSDTKPKKKKNRKKKGGNHGTNPAESAPATSADTDTAANDNPKVVEETEESEPEESDTKKVETSTETSIDDEAIRSATNGTGAPDLADTTARFDALVRDRDALRAEVTHLRQSLETLQFKHDQDLQSAQGQLQDTQTEKEQAEEQYQSLLGKVNTIRSQLGERLKADAEDLAQARTRIEELEEQKTELQERYTVKSAEVEDLASQNQAHTKELSTLRNRTNLSQQNWAREKEERVEQEAYLREEFENAKQAMHDWEVLAMEERTVRRDLADKVQDLEEQLSSLREAHERTTSERDIQSTTVDGLQKAFQDIQTARRKELREIVESSQAEMESLRVQLQEAQSASAAASTELETTKKELERALPFEKEVKEKNLLIGKLRHEAVILNDHLTKALRFLKKGKPEDNVDRQLVTNHLLHFLALDRSDPKKFQILQLIAALLSWTDEQREQAGLQRMGGPADKTWTGSMRLPKSPDVHRTPSTPMLSSEYFQDPGLTNSPHSKESLSELWQNFLEQEANSSAGSKSGKQRTGSTSTTTTAVGGTPKIP